MNSEVTRTSFDRNEHPSTVWLKAKKMLQGSIRALVTLAVANQIAHPSEAQANTRDYFVNGNEAIVLTNQGNNVIIVRQGTIANAIINCAPYPSPLGGAVKTEFEFTPPNAPLQTVSGTSYAVDANRNAAAITFVWKHDPKSWWEWGNDGMIVRTYNNEWQFYRKYDDYIVTRKAICQQAGNNPRREFATLPNHLAVTLASRRLSIG